jgi:hypothetical protein
MRIFLAPIFLILYFLWLAVPNYYFLEKIFSLDQYQGSYEHSAHTQYMRKEVSVLNHVDIVYALKIVNFENVMLRI